MENTDIFYEDMFLETLEDTLNANSEIISNVLNNGNFLDVSFYIKMNDLIIKIIENKKPIDYIKKLYKTNDDPHRPLYREINYIFSLFEGLKNTPK